MSEVVTYEWRQLNQWDTPRKGSYVECVKVTTGISSVICRFVIVKVTERDGGYIRTENADESEITQDILTELGDCHLRGEHLPELGSQTMTRIQPLDSVEKCERLFYVTEKKLHKLNGSEVTSEVVDYVIDLLDRLEVAERENTELREVLSESLSSFNCTQKLEHYSYDNWPNRADRILNKQESES